MKGYILSKGADGAWYLLSDYETPKSYRFKTSEEAQVFARLNNIHIM